MFIAGAEAIDDTRGVARADHWGEDARVGRRVTGRHDTVGTVHRDGIVDPPPAAIRITKDPAAAHSLDLREGAP